MAIRQANQRAYEVVTQSVPLPNQDQKFWWAATAESLAHLLASCEYSEEDQITHLRWYHRFIIPALGPRPIPGVKPKFQPCPVADGSACELSINWKELDPKKTVRFTIEAVGHNAGTSSDPFNQEETVHLLEHMSKEIPDLDLDRFQVFASKLFLPSDAVESLMLRVSPGIPLSQVWVAFDLLHGKVMAKVYFMPILKMISTGIPTKTLVFEAAQACNGKYGSFDAPIQLLDSYLNSFPPSEAPVVEMVAIDCIDSPNSRIKIYLRTSVDTLAKAKWAYTLGGRLSGTLIEEGLQALGELWPILFRIKSTEFENEKILPGGSYCGNAIEMKPGSREQEIKIHIPVGKLDGTDRQLCESLSAWFKVRGQSSFAKTYKTDLESAL